MKLPEFQYLLPGRYRASDALEYNHPAHGWIEVAQDGFYREIREVVGDLPPGFDPGFLSPNRARRKIANGEWCPECRRIVDPRTCGYCGEWRHDDTTDHKFKPLYCLCNAQIVRQDSSVRSTSGPDLAHDPKNGWTLNGVPIQELIEDAISDCETVSQVRMALHDLGLLKGYEK